MSETLNPTNFMIEPSFLYSYLIVPNATSAWDISILNSTSTIYCKSFTFTEAIILTIAIIGVT